MTYQFLTVQMVESISEGGIINPSIHLRHGFDLLIFSNYVLTLIKNYINFIWPRLNPYCDYRLICPNGKADFEIKQHLWDSSFLSDWKIYKPDTIQADCQKSKYTKTYFDEQACHSEDEKHKSNVAKIHYEKLILENIDEQG